MQTLPQIDLSFAQGIAYAALLSTVAVPLLVVCAFGLKKLIDRFDGALRRALTRELNGVNPRDFGESIVVHKLLVTCALRLCVEVEITEPLTEAEKTHLAVYTSLEAALLACAAHAR